MRPFNVKLLGCIGLILISAMVIHGCGSGNDLLDEVGGRYVFDLELADGGEDAVHQIDLVQILDCDADGTADDPEDPLTDVIGTISVEVVDDAPGVTMLSYVVNYYPTPGVDSGGIVRTPPAITSKSGQFNSFFVDSGGSNADSIIVMTHDQKNTLVNALAADPATYGNVVTVLYSIEVAVTFQDYEGNTTTKYLYIDVEMFNVDRC